jgi:hypothetical protein
MKALLIIIVSIILIIVHRKAIKTYYPYRWLMLSIAYPFLYYHYKSRLKYLSKNELEKVIDKLVKQRDSWFIRGLLNLTVSYRLRLGIYQP